MWREGGWRESRGSREREGGERERLDREREDRKRLLRAEESEKDTETDTGPATVRAKKTHLAQILLSDIDEEALVEYIRNQPELYDKGH